jgi:anti-sigma regulatory factor (Ser/Thr protein kinase)
MDGLEDRLELDSSLTELSRVWVWTESLADKLRLPGETRFALHLCLEEALANVILHGYRNEPGHPIVIRSSMVEGRLLFTIEDEAPAFAPPEGEAERPADLETLEPGGNGIRLLRRFAGSLTYETLAHGNRLTLGFPLGQGLGMVAQARSA